jgi:hypothetical protein
MGGILSRLEPSFEKTLSSSGMVNQIFDIHIRMLHVFSPSIAAN